MNNMKLADSLLKTRLLSTLVTMVLQLPVSFSSNPTYGTCSPKKCGSVHITYPFYIVNEQLSYCGYPGFEVSCLDGETPRLNISGHSYVIQQIWHTNQSFQVMNSAIMDFIMGGRCPTLITNQTLEDSFFKFVMNHSNIILLQNCPDKVLGENEHAVMRCGAIALYENDPRLKDLAGKCDGVVSAPYEGDSGTNLTEVLSRGVLLNWKVNNCSACVDTGGQCGFNRNTNEFRCFCPDKDHAYHCVPLGGRSKLLIIGPVSAALLLGIILISLVICLKRR